jgi:hypothetical protein
VFYGCIQRKLAQTSKRDDLLIVSQAGACFVAAWRNDNAHGSPSAAALNTGSNLGGDSTIALVSRDGA